MMRREKIVRSHRLRAIALGAGCVALFPQASPAASAIALTPAAMARIGSVDPRFPSYNIEMVEVTGGHFSRPYRDDDQSSGAPSLFAYRKPIDLANSRLRKLAVALGPAFMRVSGTW